MLCSLRGCCLAVLLLATTAAPVRADWLVTPFMGLWFKGQTSLVDLDRTTSGTQTGIGVATALTGEGPLGLEADASFVPRFFERGSGGLVAGSRVFALTGSLILSLPRSITRESLRPYIVVGGGLINAHIDDVIGALDVRTTMPAVSLGGGATGMLSPNTGIRFDLRYVRGLGTGDELRLVDTARLRYWRGSIGYVRRF